MGGYRQVTRLKQPSRLPVIEYQSRAVVCKALNRFDRVAVSYLRRIVLTLRKTLSIVVILIAATAAAAQDRAQTSYAILVDNTGSMRSQFAVVHRLAKQLVAQLHQRGPVAIYSFSSGGVAPGKVAVPTRAVDATQDEQLLKRTIDNIYVQGGQTALLDAIDLIQHDMTRKSAVGNVIILLTDGEDRVSANKASKLIERLKQARVTVFAVGLVTQLDSRAGLIGESTRAKATKLLKTITHETGGRVVLPATDTFDLQQLISELAVP